MQQIRYSPVAGIICLAYSCAMLKGRDIICIASADWDALWVNAQHLMSRLSANNRVIYVNNMGLRAPGASAADMGKVWRRIRSWFAGARRINGNLHVISPISIPLHRFALIRALNRFLLRIRIRRLSDKLGFDKPILWAFLPTAADLVGRLGESRVIYQCVDDYTANPGVDKETLREMESRLEAAADLVIVTSPALRDAKQNRVLRLFYSPNCADVPRFRDSEGPPPKTLADAIRGRRVIGYVGNISAYKTDLALLGDIADAFPDCALVLAGPQGWGDPGTDVAALAAKSNVILTGRVANEDIPAVTHAFDVAILPLAANDSTRASFPMKLYEYMACGLPIVATDLPSFAAYRDRPDLCRLAKGRTEFIESVREALAENPVNAKNSGTFAGPKEELGTLAEPNVPESRVREAETHDWAARVEEIGGEVEKIMNPAGRKVALVHDWLTGMRGGEKVLEVLCELYPDADLYTLLHIKGRMSPAIERMNIRTSFIQRMPFAATKYRNYLPLFPLAVEQFDLRGYDLVISTSHCVAKGVVTPPSTCHISYIHTPMRYVWELYDDYFGPQRVKNPLKRALISAFASRLRLWDAASANRVDHYLCNSRHVAKRIAKHYRREAVVINPPVDAARYVPSSVPGDYYLVVSAFAPYKRIDLAVEAARRRGFPLKIAGIGEDLERMKRISGPTVEFLGWVPDDLLPALYAGCKAFLFPGEEDFGITPLEAQACGRPVIAYAKGGALETVRGADAGQDAGIGVTGVFFREQTVESLLEAIDWFESNRSLFDAAKIRAHAEGFGRERFRERMREFIETTYDHFLQSGETTP